MRIGILSDTHFDDIAKGIVFLNSLMDGPFQGVEMVLHAGDLVRDEVLDGVTGCPVYAVRGNMDVKSDFPFKRVVSAGSFQVGLIHGWGPPLNLERRLVEEFASERLDVLVYGHSHRPVCHKVGDILIFNPGSAADRRDAPHHTVGILHVNDVIHGEIINLD